MMMMQMLRIKAMLLTMSLKTVRLMATMAVTMKMKMLTTDDDDDDHYIYTR